MGEIRDSVISVRKEPWFYSVLLLSLVPLFPDYLCFPLVLVAFFLSVLDAKKQRRQISFGKLGIGMAVYLGYMGLSIVYSTDRRGSFWTFIMWSCLFLAYLSASTVLFSRRRLRSAILCMTTVTGVVGGIAVGQYLLREYAGWHLDDMFWEAVDRFVYGLLQIPVSNEDFGARVSGTFNNPNLLAAYLVLTIPFSIAFVLTGTRSKPKATARMALILAVYALGFSFCRGGYLAFIAVGGLLLLIYARRRFVMTVLTVMYIVLLIPNTISNRLISVIPSGGDASADSMVETLPEGDFELPDKLQQLEQDVTVSYQDDQSVSMRFVMWKRVIKSVAERPLFGAGAGIQTTQKTLSEAGLNFKHSHNLILEILAQGGIVSLLLFIGVLGLLAQRGFRMLRRRENKEIWLLGFAVFGACGALFVFGVFDFPLLTPRIICTCMLLMGITENGERLYLHNTDELHRIKSAEKNAKLQENTCNCDKV